MKATDTPDQANNEPSVSDSLSSAPGTRVVGSSVPRTEDGRLLTGRGFYVADVELPRMLYASFVRSYLPHARVARVTVAAACSHQPRTPSLPPSRSSAPSPPRSGRRPGR